MIQDPWKVLAEFDCMARLDLWPGFEPSKVPLALFDGKQTLLVRHPQPPQEFQPSERPEVYIYKGQLVRANSSIELGGVRTAALLLDAKHSTTELAAMLIHEAFHVFQQEHHPDWCANEAEFFVYPVEDVELLRLRHLETQLLHRALKKQGEVQAAAALQARYDRFQRMPGGSIAYERGTELNEGLAQYIESLALGQQELLLPDEEFAAEEVRHRGYAIGQALAQLLDCFDLAWKEKLEAGRARSLDELLWTALSRRSVPTASFTEQEQRQALAWAQSEAQRVRARRKALREEFFARPGWRIVIEAKKPLWPQGFDPMNVHHLGGKEVLHTRWLKLGDESTRLEVLNHWCLTEAAGEHPLCYGVRRAIIVGLPEEPQLEAGKQTLRVKAEGVELEALGAWIERTCSSLLVYLRRGA